MFSANAYPRRRSCRIWTHRARHVYRFAVGDDVPDTSAASPSPAPRGTATGAIRTRYWRRSTAGGSSTGRAPRLGCAIIVVVNEEISTRRTDAILVVVAVLVPAVSGLAVLLWAGAREYRDNQRNWALIGGWVGLTTAGVVALVGLAGLVRRQGSRRAQLVFATILVVVSIVLLVVAVSIR